MNRIITELAVIDVTADGLVLREINKNTTVEDVVRLTPRQSSLSPKISEPFE